MRILTFDLEEWFHLLDNPSTNSEENWNNFESRIENNLNRILTIIKESNTSATFFCLGWIAKKYPHLIKRIVDFNYEIACHSNNHQLAYNQSKISFKEDLKSAKGIIEEISGKKLKCYRVPGFSLTEKNLWILDILAKEGFEVDCSVFPANRSHGGIPTFKYDRPCLIELHDKKFIKELPLNTSNFIGKKFVFSGGGYFRLIPYFILKKLFTQSNYIMTYFHPRDFDPDQPVIKDLSLIRKFKSYYGLKNSEKKLIKIINEFNFIDVSKAVQNIDWEKAPKINMKY